LYCRQPDKSLLFLNPNEIHFVAACRYGPTSFPSPLGDGATAVLPYVVFAEPDRRAVVCNATVPKNASFELFLY
jgi:hypothetical protein